MKDNDFIKICIEAVINYFNNRVEITDDMKITEKDIFIVWSCKALQNNKALLSTTVSDGMYYELTYNGNKKELYLDAYKKWENICIKIIGIETPKIKPYNPETKIYVDEYGKIREMD